MKHIKIVSLVMLIILGAVGYKLLESTVFDNTDYNSDSIYVYNLSENKIEVAINENKRRKPASLAKLMTAWIGLNYCESLDQISPIDESTYISSIENNASMAGFVSNETTTVRDLLYGTILPSGAECANTLAMNTFGSRENFVEMMNQEASNLGMTNTHFENPDGMDDPNQYTTAKDIAILLSNCIQDENYYVVLTRPNYLSSPTLDHPEGLWMDSTVSSKLMNYQMDSGSILGGKSGTTEEAGLCWATLAEKDNQYYIIVVMGAPVGDIANPNEGQVADTIKILNEL